MSSYFPLFVSSLPFFATDLIFDFIEQHWEAFKIGQRGGHSWRKALQDALSHNSQFFESGQIFVGKTGYWRISPYFSPWSVYTVHTTNSKKTKAWRTGGRKSAHLNNPISMPQLSPIAVPAAVSFTIHGDALLNDLMLSATMDACSYYSPQHLQPYNTTAYLPQFCHQVYCTPFISSTQQQQPSLQQKQQYYDCDALQSPQESPYQANVLPSLAAVSDTLHSDATTSPISQISLEASPVLVSRSAEQSKTVIPSIDVLLGEKRGRCGDSSCEDLPTKRTRTEAKWLAERDELKGLCELISCPAVNDSIGSSVSLPALSTSKPDKMKLLYETAMEAIS